MLYFFLLSSSPAQSTGAAAAQSIVHYEPVRSSIDIEDFFEAIEAERLRLARAHAATQAAAPLLHERFILEHNEPDIGFVLDVVVEMIEHSIGGLDRITAESL